MHSFIINILYCLRLSILFEDFNVYQYLFAFDDNCDVIDCVT